MARDDEVAMKLMIVNPNSSETVTGAIMESARRGAAPGTELIGVTTKGGTRNVDSAFGDYLSGAFAVRTCLEAAPVHAPDAVGPARCRRGRTARAKGPLSRPRGCPPQLTTAD